MQAIFHFGHKILCDGHVINIYALGFILLIISTILYDTYVIKHFDFLYDGYLIKAGYVCCKVLIINIFLFDGYLINLNNNE